VSSVTAAPQSTDGLAGPTLQRPGFSSAMSSFWGLFIRDARVLRRSLGEFLPQTLMQPLLFVFVFTYVFPKIGENFSIGHGITFATLLVPGLIGTSALFSGISSVATPLSIDFGATMEIEDRALAPIPVWSLGLQKILWGAVQALLSALIVFPLVYLIPATPVSVSIHNWPLFVAVAIMICLTSGAMGLLLGSIVKPQHIGLMYGILVIPLTFLGCVYYPWAVLKPVAWLHWAVLINPLVYATEGARDALTPSVPHMPIYAFLGAGYGIMFLLIFLGLRSFVRRVLS
jgi:ABC-2 type transport system permease protein